MAKSAKQAIREAPVTSLTAVESAVGFVLTFLVAHHVIGDIDVSATTQTVAPFIALLIPAIFGSAKWRLVSPADKVKDIAERDGAMSDADYARIEALIDERLDAALHRDLPTPSEDELRPTPRPSGMSAGGVDGHRPRGQRHLALSNHR